MADHRSRRAPAPTSDTRLLEGWYETGRAAGLADHLRRYDPMPVRWLRPGARDPLIDAIERSGLTGRGGAAFPTGRKMRAVAGAGHGAVVVANGMESEPASRKDATLMDLAPHLVLDGMSLAAIAVGADEAHLCVPRSRPRKADYLTALAAERRRAGVDPVRLHVHTLPHHHVSSEETSLVRWLNGGDARPSSVPPRPFERGVGGLPTLVDNVETLAHLALVARYGPDWFRTLGTPDAPGTTLVTLTGAVPARGVYEVELGLSVRDVACASGEPPEPPQALLLGGYFGSWLPAGHAAELAYGPTALARAGAAIGAGVVAVLPRGACGLAETALVLDYLAGQSAQQCGPCRFGLPATAADFAQLAFGRASGARRRQLEEHIAQLAGRGACKHPDGASRLAASALRTFAPEVDRHLSAGPCRAARSMPPALSVPQRAPIGEDEWR
jgi:NADH:ubiquinone oxidoreductase subunit F (NADH-binding)